MAKSDKISRFLPISFRNNTKVHRFGKHCPHCRTMVSADRMEGIASLINNKIFIAAKGSCPVCNTRFAICCIITDDKQVHRVLLPGWIFRRWLAFTVRNDPQPLHHQEWELANKEHDSHKGLVLTDSNLVVHSDEVLGSYQGKKISAWIEYQGKRFVFERAAPLANLQQLNENELLFEGQLIYKLA